MAPANPSLQKRAAARMAAAQCLYTRAMSGDAPSPAEAVASLKEQLANNREEQKLRIGSAVEPNYKLVEMLLTGVGQWEAAIDARLEEALSREWKRERMSPLLVAILQCAIFEMFFAKEISPKIVINEYCRLTRHFFAEAEVDFVHAALSRLARQYGALPGLPSGDG